MGRRDVEGGGQAATTQTLVDLGEGSNAGTARGDRFGGQGGALQFEKERKNSSLGKSINWPWKDTGGRCELVIRRRTQYGILWRTVKWSGAG